MTSGPYDWNGWRNAQGDESADDDPAVEFNQHYRTAPHRSQFLDVVDVRFGGDEDLPSGHEEHFLVNLTYDGAFTYSVAQQRWIIDSSRILFVAPGRFFREQHLIAGTGHAAILICPSEELLDDICGTSNPSDRRLFDEVSRSAPMKLRLMVQFLRNAISNKDLLSRDEWAIHALREAMQSTSSAHSRHSKVVEKAKELLHVRATERLSLSEIAKDVGVSPVYLTQEFARSEGTPLYRYQLNLKLTRSLLLLRECDDITGLALDLGFSSHSHFTAEFRRAFGLPPSRYRAAIVSPQPQIRDFVSKLAADTRSKQRPPAPQGPAS